ncbi:OmpA family protein [Sphingosinicella sp. CPCC 101087]|uniref:OmpA family protein n=1 Tax=Sphingosinicella sp. CPCC 101087 TaxID=2497754 RepID=UPI00101DCF49|nr:OmpA family protein [Sphingosinicella sp. CPCC 101087]
MTVISKSPRLLLLLATLAGTVPVSLAAQPQDQPEDDISAIVGDSAPPEAAETTEGPEIEGIISARNGDQVQVITADGTTTTIAVTSDTRITASGGFLGLGRTQLAADWLLTGLPVSVETLQSGSGLVASEIDLKNRDLRTASMIHSGTAQRFAEQGAAIHQNAAATEALRGRMGDIDQYNVKRTTNVNFDFGEAALSDQAKADLCATAAAAEAMDNALLLVVGYTDAVGSVEFNQALSERRAGSVVNHLQQACGWKPYRMLTPTGMAEADPVASNDTAEGMSQNRRVAVNILVSKAVDGL